MTVRAWVYSRTSGDEDDTGQDCEAQEYQVKHTAKERGFNVVGASRDDGVSGDSDPTLRPGFKMAMQAVLDGVADVVVLRDPPRFSRQHFCLAVLSWRQVQAAGVPVVCLDNPALDGRRVADEQDDLVLVVIFYGGRAYLNATRKGTSLAMREIKAGRRKTKSGLAPGRQWKVSEEEAKRAGAWMLVEGLSLRKAAHRLSTERGAFTTTDAKLRRDRIVSHQALADRLADLRLVANQDWSASEGDQGTTVPGDMGPDGDQAVGKGDQATSALGARVAFEGGRVTAASEAGRGSGDSSGPVAGAVANRQPAEGAVGRSGSVGMDDAGSAIGAALPGAATGSEAKHGQRNRRGEVSLASQSSTTGPLGPRALVVPVVPHGGRSGTVGENRTVAGGADQ